MTSLTDRYVHAVTAQLPEAQREDIALELRGTIEDTVAASPEPDQAEAERQALRDLGHPTALADSYRGTGQHLIGPRFFPAWLRTLKTLLAWVPALVAVLMVALGLLDEDPPGNIVGTAVTTALFAALQIAFWVTLGFAIAERTDAGGEAMDALGVDQGDWDPADLPEPQKRQVTWGDAIWSVILNAFLLTLLVLPVRLGGSIDGFAWGQIFTDTAYSLRWVLAAGMAASLLASVYVLARGHWTRLTAIVNLVGMLVFTAPIVWLAARNDLYAWDTLPLEWVRDSAGNLEVNEPVTLGATIVVVVGILLWEAFDTFRKAARTP